MVMGMRGEHDDGGRTRYGDKEEHELMMMVIRVAQVISLMVKKARSDERKKYRWL